MLHELFSCFSWALFQGWAASLAPSLWLQALCPCLPPSTHPQPLFIYLFFQQDETLKGVQLGLAEISWVFTGFIQGIALGSLSWQFWQSWQGADVAVQGNLRVPPLSSLSHRLGQMGLTYFFFVIYVQKKSIQKFSYENPGPQIFYQKLHLEWEKDSVRDESLVGLDK